MTTTDTARNLWQVATNLCWPDTPTNLYDIWAHYQQRHGVEALSIDALTEGFDRLRALGYLDWDGDGVVTVLVPFGSFTAAQVVPLTMPTGLVTAKRVRVSA